MRDRASRRIAFLMLLSLSGFVAKATADSIAEPWSYVVHAPGGQFVFAMIAPKSVEEDAASWEEETAAEIRRIRRTYPRGGMYHAVGPKEPIWTVDWYAYGVEVTADGNYLIRLGSGAWLDDNDRPDLSCEAVSFYARDRLLRTYSVGELVGNSASLKRSISHYQWRDNLQERLQDHGAFEYAIVTLDGNRFVFDVRTGEVVSQWRGALVSLWGTRLMLTLAVIVVFAWLILRYGMKGRSLPIPAIEPENHRT